MLSPKVKLLFITGASIIFIYTGLFIDTYQNVPDIIPTHLNYLGEVDRWGNKDSIWIAIAVNIILSASLLLTAKKPNLWNVPKSIKKEDYPNFVERSRIALGTLNVLISIVFSSMVFYTLNYSFQVSLGIILLTVIGPTLYILFFSRKSSSTP